MVVELCVCIIFFFSSRRRHTRYIGDWSSDVCSSDLPQPLRGAPAWCGARARGRRQRCGRARERGRRRCRGGGRSEERRVGKEWRSRGATEHAKKKVKGGR